jgi:hypothetical protein
LQQDNSSLGSSAIRVQNAYAVGMLITGPGCYKDIQAILEGAMSHNQLAIHQQLSSWLYILARNADTGMPIWMRWQDDHNALQKRYSIAQAPQFTGRRQAL